MGAVKSTVASAPASRASSRLKPIALLSCLWATACWGAEEPSAPTTPPVPSGEVGPIAPIGPPDSTAPIAPLGVRDVEEPPAEPVSTVLPTPLPEGVPSLQLSTDYGSPLLSLTTYRPAGDIESAVRRVGPFHVRAAVHTGVGYDDNLGRTPSNKIGSSYITVSPRISAGIEGPEQRYYVTYRGNYATYASSSGSDYDEHNLLLSAANGWGTRLRTRFDYEFVRGQDARGTTTAASRDADAWTINAVRAGVSYGAEGAAGRLDGDVRYLTRRYENDSGAFSGRDYDVLEARGTFSVRVAPKTRGLVEIRRSDIEHKDASTRDSVETRYLVGATWDATAITRGAVRVGYLTRDSDAAGTNDYSSLTYEAALTWAPLVHTAVTASGVRTTSEAVEVGSSFVVDNVGRVSWLHQWPGRVRTALGYTYGQQEHEGLSRTDTYHLFDARVSYVFRRNLILGLEYRRDVRNSTLPAQEYQRNLTLISLEAAL